METYHFEIFAKNLKNLRKRNRLTQAALAKELNMSRSCLANYETCKRRPHVETISEIAAHFGVDAGELIGETFFSFKGGASSRASLNGASPENWLDISEFSPKARIALMEFHNYLKSRPSVK